MMTIQIITDIAVLPRPGFERLKLKLRLAHIRIEVVKVAKILRLVSSIRVRRVKPLMMFHEDQDALFPRCFHELLVLT